MVIIITLSAGISPLRERLRNALRTIKVTMVLTFKRLEMLLIISLINIPSLFNKIVVQLILGGLHLLKIVAVNAVLKKSNERTLGSTVSLFDVSESAVIVVKLSLHR